MVKLFVARHGETDWNGMNRVLGRTNVSLNNKGKAQARHLAKQLKDFQIDMIITSPLERACETGNIIATLLKVDNVTKEEVLIEQDFGIYEGCDRGMEDYQHAKRNFSMRFRGGESYFDVAARIYPFLSNIKNECEGKVVLLITHGGVCRIINSYFEDMNNEEFAKYTTPNCRYKEYVL